jgi:hypothetical protein
LDGGYFVVVKHTAPVALKEAAERLAHQFLRETAYMLPYGAAEHTGNNWEVVLFASRLTVPDSEGALIEGALGFQCRRYRDFPGWILTWVYLHPNCRTQARRGRSSPFDKAWPLVAERYDNPPAEGPITPATRPWSNGSACRQYEIAGRSSTP